MCFNTLFGSPKYDAEENKASYRMRYTVWYHLNKLKTKKTFLILFIYKIVIKHWLHTH